MLHPPWLTTKSLKSAFVRVRENHGCAGADGVSLEAFAARLDEQVETLRESVDMGRYYAWPLRKVVVEKQPGSKETRRLLVPAVCDRVLQTAVARHLEPLCEAEFNECSYAYRRGRGVRMAVEKVHQLHEQGYQWLLDADIDRFFDSVGTDCVMARLRPLVGCEATVALVRLWLDYSIWDGLRLERPGCGLPQGSVTSPLLANLVLDQLDDRLEAEGFRMVRYSDDFVVLAKSRKSIERAHRITEETLDSLQLRLHEGKTRMVRFRDGFRFLGVIFLKDMLLQPWRRGRKQLAVLESAPMLPEAFFPESEKRPLRKYRE